MQSKVEKQNSRSSNSGTKHNPKTLDGESKSVAVYVVIALIIGASIYGATLAVKNSTTMDNDGGMTDDFIPVEYEGSSDSSQTDQETATDSGYNTQLRFNTIDGNTISMESYAGKAVILYFFYLDCYYCDLMEPEIKSVQQTYDNQQLQVIAINVQPGSDSDSELQSWRASEGLDWEIVRDVDGALTNQFSVTGTPKTIYYDTIGNQVQVHSGYKEQAAIESAVQVALQ